MYGQNERVDELNQRIESRQFPDSPLEPNFDPRAVPTKYALFPIVNRRTPSKETALPYINYNGSVNFNPGPQRAPPSGFIQNVDIETTLRNQHFAHQKGAHQGIFIPDSKSDLYKVTIPSTPVEQTHPLLFERQIFGDYKHPNMTNTIIGQEQFFNHTRTQLRNS
jgi:hypothetical protein